MYALYGHLPTTVSNPLPFKVRGSPWVISRRRAGGAGVADSNGQSADGTLNCELLMMTSATLIEALYECCDDWLRDNAPGKATIADLDAEEPTVLFISQSNAG